MAVGDGLRPPAGRFRAFLTTIFQIIWKDVALRTSRKAEAGKNGTGCLFEAET
jgi:hypothetical protein